MTDRPIEPMDFCVGPKVADIGDIRVARGRTRVPRQTCPHQRLVYDDTERRVYCSDCEQDVDSFDAFIQLVKQQDAAERGIRKAWKEIQEAREETLVRRASKALDKCWRSKTTVPNCPHCNEALLPEDITGQSLTNSSAELARRRRQSTTP